MYKKLHINYQNRIHKARPPYLSEPIDGRGEVYQLTKKPIDSNNPNYHQPWNGYVPDCTLSNKEDCDYFPAQTSNITVDEIYHKIKILGDKWMQMACEESLESLKPKNKQGGEGGPFGAVILQIDNDTNEIIRYWRNHNQVTLIDDPTAHAEVMTIRSACHSLGVFNLGNINKKDSKLDQPGQLSHCIIYSSAEPCPMCFSAISWANIPNMFFAATRFDAAVQGVNFSDEEIYDELRKPYRERKMHVYQMTTDNSLSAFNTWKRMKKVDY